MDAWRRTTAPAPKYVAHRQRDRYSIVVSFRSTVAWLSWLKPVPHVILEPLDLRVLVCRKSGAFSLFLSHWYRTDAVQMVSHAVRGIVGLRDLKSVDSAL